MLVYRNKDGCPILWLSQALIIAQLNYACKHSHCFMGSLLEHKTSLKVFQSVKITDVLGLWNQYCHMCIICSRQKVGGWLVTWTNWCECGSYERYRPGSHDVSTDVALKLWKQIDWGVWDKKGQTPSTLLPCPQTHSNNHTRNLTHAPTRG